jgi:hypothetical protein
MKRSALFALLALVPAAVRAAVPLPAGALTVALCTGDGSARTITLPAGPADPLRPAGEGCCAKGCHAGGSRKRATCHV